jgi:hypothetical protein
MTILCLGYNFSWGCVFLIKYSVAHGVCRVEIFKALQVKLTFLPDLGSSEFQISTIMPLQVITLLTIRKYARRSCVTAAPHYSPPEHSTLYLKIQKLNVAHQEHYRILDYVI